MDGHKPKCIWALLMVCDTFLKDENTKLVGYIMDRYLEGNGGGWWK